MSFLTHLECARCGDRFDPHQLLTLSACCRAPLLARYDLAAAGRTSWEHLGRSEGILVCPEGGAGLEELVYRGWIRPEEQVVLFNTGSGYQYRK